MLHSTVTSKGQTTIPGEIREALGIKPGDKLQYTLQDNSATIRIQPGVMALKGTLRSDKGNGLSFAEIRRRAAANYFRSQGHKK